VKNIVDEMLPSPFRLRPPCDRFSNLLNFAPSFFRLSHHDHNSSPTLLLLSRSSAASQIPGGLVPVTRLTAMTMITAVAA